MGIMILCIDLGTDMLPAISLAYEEPEGGIMKRKPRDKAMDRLVNAKLIALAYGHIGMTRENSIFTQGMTNMTLNVGLFEETVLAIALVYCPPFQDAFGTESLDFKMWCYGVPFSLLIWVYG